MSAYDTAQRKIENTFSPISVPFLPEHNRTMLLRLLLCAALCDALQLRLARALPSTSVRSRTFTATWPPPATLAATRHSPVLAIVEPQTFEAQFDPVQFVVLLLAVGGPFGYWWLITVPEARLALAKDKRLEGGETKEFLAELKGSEGRPVEKWFFAKWLAQARPSRGGGVTRGETTKAIRAESSAQSSASGGVGGGVGAGEGAGEGGGEGRGEGRGVGLQELFKPASLKGNATPKFFSGDNPIVVTVGSLMVLGIGASIARENGQLAIDLSLVGAGLAFGLTRLDLK